MSLVNDMLQDLEDRQDHDSQKATGASSVISHQNTSMSRGSKLSFTIGLVLILLAAALWSWHNAWWRPPAVQQAEPANLAGNAVMQKTETEAASVPDTLPVEPAATIATDETSQAEAAVQQTEEIAIEPGIEPVVPPQSNPEPIVAQQSTEAVTAQPVEPSPPPPANEPVPQQPLPKAEKLTKAIAQSVTPSASTLDQKAADTARQLIDDGQTQRARSLLENHLQQYPEKAVKSAMALAKLHLDNSNHAALDQLLATTSALQPAQIALLQAQSLLARGQPDQARALLEKSPPDVEQYPDYHALLAGLYHKSGKHREAATLYSSLVSVQPESSIYWLGLAVALDALQDRNALQAFRRTRALNDNPDVRAYIEQRIATLSEKR